MTKASSSSPQPSGALVRMPQLAPRDNGTLVYLHGGEELNLVLERVKAADGEPHPSPGVFAPAAQSSALQNAACAPKALFFYSVFYFKKQ